jgi:hypothetical protein
MQFGLDGGQVPLWGGACTCGWTGPDSTDPDMAVASIETHVADSDQTEAMLGALRNRIVAAATDGVHGLAWGEDDDAHWAHVASMARTALREAYGAGQADAI